jgi:hypothetical protein
MTRLQRYFWHNMGKERKCNILTLLSKYDTYSANQLIALILRNLKVHHGLRNSLKFIPYWGNSVRSTILEAIHFSNILILTSYPCLCLPNSSYFQIIPPTICMHFSSRPCILIVLTISPYFIWLSQSTWWEVDLHTVKLLIMLSIYFLLIYLPRI